MSRDEPSVARSERPPQRFTEFVAARGDRLFRTAVLLTRNEHDAQDLVQNALAKAWGAWPRISADPAPYVHRIMVNDFLSSKRRRWSGERPTDLLPERPVHDRRAAEPDDPAHVVTTARPLADAVAALPPRQRAVVVLRYFHDLTETQTADAMGVALGTVKSQHAKALAALRISDHLDDSEGPSTDRHEAIEPGRRMP